MGLGLSVTGFGLKTADGAEAEAVVGEVVEEAGVGNTKEGEA